MKSNPAALAALEDLFGEARAAAHHALRVKVALPRPRAAEKIVVSLDDTQFYLRPAPRTEERPLPRHPEGATLTFPAPHRETIQTDDGWIDQAWSEAGVRRVLASGGYFARGQHTFASAKVAYLAINRKDQETHTPVRVRRPLFGDEILKEFWAAQAAAMPY